MVRAVGLMKMEERETTPPPPRRRLRHESKKALLPQNITLINPVPQRYRKSNHLIFQVDILATSTLSTYSEYPSATQPEPTGGYGR